MKQPLYFHWGISMLYGWGVYGLNLLRHWPGVSGSPAYCIGKIHLESLGGMDPLALRVLAQPLVDSDQMRLRVNPDENAGQKLDGVLLQSLGNFMSGGHKPSDGGVSGTATAAAIFFEDSNLPNAAEIAKDYRVIVAGSTWCEEVLRANGVEHTRTVVQGTDPSLFHPAPRAGWLDGRFAVFSGGKIEVRKGQDIVLLAFRAFAERHPEAILVTAWHSPWPIAAVTVNANPRIAPIGFTPDGAADIKSWVAANGIAEHQFIDLGPIPNHAMAKVLREMDVALFPNRCEGGTNLVAMECMACGLPTIVSNNTGHRDLVATGGAFALNRQGPLAIPGKGTDGWGESDIDEIVAMLDAVWADRENAKAVGLRAAAAMHEWNWRNQINKLHGVLAAYCE